MKRLLARNADVGNVLASAAGQLGAADLDDLLQRTARLAQVKRWTAAGGYPPLGELGDGFDIPPRGELEAEFNWAVAVLKLHSERLSALLQQKEDFETHLLSDNQELARTTLADLVRDHGWSLWAIEAKLLLARLAHGADACQREMNQILDECTSVSVRLFTIFAAARLEGDVPPAQHDRQVAATVAALKDEHDLGDDYSNYYRFIEAVINLPAASDWTRESLAYALHGFQLFSVLDWYLFSLTALQAAVANPELVPERQVLLRHVQRFVSLVPTRESRQLSAYLFPRTAHPSLVQADIIGAADLYTAGDYAGAVELCTNELNKHPHALEYLELLVRASSFAGSTTSVVLHHSVTREVHRFLPAVILRTADSPGHTQMLLSMSYRYRCTAFGRRLFSMVAAESASNHPLGSNAHRFLTSTTLSPRSSRLMPTSLLGRVCLNRIAELTTDSLSLLLFRSLDPDELTADEVARLDDLVPRARRLRYAGLAAEAHKEYSNAVALLRESLALGSTSPLGSLDTNLDLLRVLRSAGEPAEAMVVAANLYVARPWALQRRNLEDIVEGTLDANSSAEAHVSHAILAYVLQKLTRSTLDSSELYPLVENALNSLEVRRPSQIDLETARFHEKLVFFLANVCAPDILDWSLEYSDSHDVEGERILICRLLQRLDKVNVATYAEEIDRRTKAAAIQKVMQVASLGKVHVDTDGIRRSLGQQVENGAQALQLAKLLERDLERYVGAWLRSSANRSQQDRYLVLSETQLAKVLQRGLYIFATLFDVVKERFIGSDEYGLDSYLSVRIRHGTLAGHLRGTFERRALVTRRDGDGLYIPNDRWMIEAPAEVREAVQSLLASFSHGVDEVIERLKGEFIQIRGKNHPEGVFDFTYGTVDTLRVYDKIASQPDSGALLDSIFEELWNRTEHCLIAVRDALRSKVSSEFMAALDELETGVRSATNGDGADHLVNSIANSRTEIQNELNAVAAWFHIADIGTLADYELGVALEAAIETVRRNHNLGFRATTSTKVPCLLRGSTLPHVLDVCYILLENIVRHSGQEQPSATVSFGTNDAGRLILSVTNEIPPWANEVDLLATASRLEGNAHAALLEGVRTEGGSGYRKLGKLLKHDLADPGATVEVNVEHRRFCVTIGLDFRRVDAASSDQGVAL